jgi:hypothetical protein
MSAEPMTYEQLATRWHMHPRTVRRICNRWGLKPMDLGHRTKLFRPVDVERAEARMAGEGQGRKAR